MIYIYGLTFLIYFMLVVESKNERKKYKNFSGMKKLLLGISYKMYRRLFGSFIDKNISALIRKISVLSGEKHREAVENYFVYKLLDLNCILILVSFLGLAMECFEKFILGIEGISGYIWKIGTLIIVFYVGVSYSRLREEADKRDRLLMHRYPEFVNNLGLLQEAGLTVRGAFLDISNTYGEEDMLGREIKLAVKQMEMGKEEGLCYEELGTGIGLMPYIRLMNNISSNLKSGSGDIVKLLRMESLKALDIQKNNAKKMGELASTKLLFPMVMLMAVVMLIILVPAFAMF